MASGVSFILHCIMEKVLVEQRLEWWWDLVGTNDQTNSLWRGDVEMSKKLTEKSLEKKLHNMGTEELIQIIMSLYRSNKSVEQSINLQIIGDAYGNELLEKYKKRIYKIFNPSDNGS